MLFKNKDLIDSAQNTIIAARTGDYGNAVYYLNHFLLQFQTILTKKKINPEDLKAVNFSLETLFAMQKSEDWIAFADVLEYEFIPLWKRLP